MKIKVKFTLSSFHNINFNIKEEREFDLEDDLGLFDDSTEQEIRECLVEVYNEWKDSKIDGDFEFKIIE